MKQEVDMASQNLKLSVIYLLLLQKRHLVTIEEQITLSKNLVEGAIL